MSTRSTKGLYEADGLSIHVYHELGDSATHVEIDYGMNSYINIVVPPLLGMKLSKLIESLPTDATHPSNTDKESK